MSELKAKEQLIELFELVSGCQVSDYDESQLPFLADYIQGQLEANDMCIKNQRDQIAQLQAEKAELMEFVKNVSELEIDTFEFQVGDTDDSDYINYVSPEIVEQADDLLNKLQ